MDFLEQHKIPLGGWISDFVDFLNTHAAWFFNFISSVLGFLIEGLIDVLQAVPALLLIALLAGFAFWLHRSIWLVVRIVLSLLLIVNIGYWTETIDTLALVPFATSLCMLIGVPVGIAPAHRPCLYTAFRPVPDPHPPIPPL